MTIHADEMRKRFTTTRQAVVEDNERNPYLERQAAELRLIEREEKLAIPTGLDFAQVPGLSAEMRQRLAASRPTTLGGAGRVSGVTPAALAALAVHLRRAEACFT